MSSQQGQGATREKQDAPAEEAQEAAPLAPQKKKKKKKPDPLLGRSVGGRYTITQRIGAGGMGVVYKAKQGAVDRDVAIKVLLSKPVEDSDEYDTLVQRFHLEARAASKLSHPNTITIYDFGQDQELLYIAMEFLAGQSLEGVMKKGAMGPQRTVRIIMQACNSLSEAHKKNIVHRDIKPDNIFLISMGGEPDFVKVLDFGVAKLRGPEKDKTLTKAGMIFGTPKYMSPEQARCMPLDSRSDIYALGVMMYQMLMGSVPFDADDHVSILLMHCSEPPEPFAKRRPDLQIPPELEAVVFKALMKDRDARYQSVDEMAAALEQIAAKFQFVARTGLLPTVPSYQSGNNPTVSPYGNPTPSGMMAADTLSGASGDFNILDTVGPDPTSMTEEAPISIDAPASGAHPTSAALSGGHSGDVIGRKSPEEAGLTSSGSYAWDGGLKLDLGAEAPPSPSNDRTGPNKQVIMVVAVGVSLTLLVMIVLAVIFFGGSGDKPPVKEPVKPPVTKEEPTKKEEPVEEVNKDNAAAVADADAGNTEEGQGDAGTTAQEDPPPAEPAKLMLVLSSQPPNAQIFIDDQKVDNKQTPTSITVEMPPEDQSKLKVTFKLKGHKDHDVELEIRERTGEVELKHHAKLKRKPRGKGGSKGGLPTADELFGQ